MEPHTASSQLGLLALWSQGDLIKALDIVKYQGLSRRTETFWHSESFEAGLNELGPHAGNPFVEPAHAGREATAHHRNAQTQLHDTLDISDWVIRTLRNSIDDSTARFQSGLAILASVGSTAPFVGLFGTVWGIYHALMGISSEGIGRETRGPCTSAPNGRLPVGRPRCPRGCRWPGRLASR